MIIISPPGRIHWIIVKGMNFRYTWLRKSFHFPFYPHPFPSLYFLIWTQAFTFCLSIFRPSHRFSWITNANNIPGTFIITTTPPFTSERDKRKTPRTELSFIFFRTIWNINEQSHHPVEFGIYSINKIIPLRVKIRLFKPQNKTERKKKNEHIILNNTKGYYTHKKPLVKS